MRKWLGKHPNISMYAIVSLGLLCVVSFALYGMAQKQLQMTGAAKEQQFFALCRSHAEKGLIRLKENQNTAEAAHNILSAAEYLTLCGDKGKEAAQCLRQNGEILLNGGTPDKKVIHLLETITAGRIPYIPPVNEEETSADVLLKPHPLMKNEQLHIAERCIGVSNALTEIRTPDNIGYSAYTCHNLYLLLATEGFPLEYSIYLPYRGVFYEEEYCRQTAIWWIRTNIPRDILGTDVEIETCERLEQGYYMTVRCKNGIMDIFIRDDNGKVGWFNGKMLEI